MVSPFAVSSASKSYHEAWPVSVGAGTAGVGAAGSSGLRTGSGGFGTGSSALLMVGAGVGVMSAPPGSGALGVRWKRAPAKMAMARAAAREDEP